jgi:hypothetical protein
LAHHLPAQTRVGLPLYLHQRWDAVLIDEQVVDCPSTSAAVFGWNRLLALDQKPPPRQVGIYQIT